MKTIRFHALFFFATGFTLASAQTYVFTPLAGRTSAGYADGVGRAALFNDPWAVAVDASGNVFVADRGNHVIRKITPAGIVSTLAGAPGQRGSADGMGRVARFNFPRSITVDGAGNVYVADDGTIRKVSPAGLVTTLAGRTGARGNIDGPGSSARFSFGPDYLEGDIAADREGNLFVADAGNRSVRKVTAAGVVSTFAGNARGPGSVTFNGAPLLFTYPVRVTVDRAGIVFVTDRTLPFHVHKITPTGEVTSTRVTTNNWQNYGVAVDRLGNIFILNSDDGGFGFDSGYVEKISPGGTSTFVVGFGGVGSEDGAGNAASFLNPQGFTMDESGNIFVADTANHAIRKISPNWDVTTVAGSSPIHADGPGGEARFRMPDAVAVDRAGNVYVSDFGAIRRISPDGNVSTVVRAAISPGPYNFGQSLAVDDTGNVFVFDEQLGKRTFRKVSPAGIVTTLTIPDVSNQPFRLALDRAGAIYFTDQDALHKVALHKVTPDGKVIRLTEAQGSFAVNSRGDVLLSDVYAIRRLSLEGRLTIEAGALELQGSEDGAGGAARFLYPRIIGVDAADNLFVADGPMIRKISNGVVTTLVTTPIAEGLAHGWNTAAVDSAGTIYLISDRSIFKGVPVPIGTPESRLANASILAALRPEQPLVAGFNRRNSASPVLVRAIGPGLVPFAPGVVVANDPRLDLFDPSGALVASNDNWGGGTALTASFTSAGAFPLATSSTDAALFGTLATQGTVHVTSPTSGLGLVELFDLGAADVSGITNLSVRHAIGSDVDSTLTLGFTIEGPSAKTVLVRGIGPGLAASPFGVSGALGDPMISIVDGNGRQISANDNWNPALAATFARVGAFALPRSPGTLNSPDAAVLLTLPPGGYSAVLNGVLGATGEAMIEIYELDP